MSEPTDPRREHPSTYMVPRSQEEELTRLLVQDQMLSAGMGILAEQPDPAIFGRVLDVGCGVGNWLIEAARTYSSMTRLAGVDASERMITYARAQAEAHHVSDRVQFHVMDALRMLEFPANSFDLVNQRLGLSYLRTWDWWKLLQEYQRVTRPGGVIRITECDMVTESSSPALLRLNQLVLQAFYHAGHFFTPDSFGVTNQLAHLLHQHGFQGVQTRPYTFKYRIGTPEGDLFYEDTRHVYRVVVPFLRKWTRVPDDYEMLYQQMLDELHQPDCVTTWTLLTAWGTNSHPRTSASYFR